MKRIAQLDTLLRKLRGPWALVVALVWMELTLKLSTTGGMWPQALFVLLFSVAAATVARLALSLLPGARANKMATCALMALAGVAFCVEYFVYRAFKLFYDLNTVLAGAGDAATGFSDQILSLVLSPAGIAHVALFLAPALLYWRFGEGEDLAAATGDAFDARMRLLRDAAVTQLAALLAVASVGTFGRSYSDQYSFQSAVTNFGMVTSLRKEVGLMAFGNASQLTFTQPDERDEDEEGTTAPADETGETAADRAEGDDSPQAQEPPAASALPADAPAYGQSELDINFSELAASTDGTWAELDRYVASLAPSSKNAMTGKFQGYNLIFVSGEAFSAEAIREDTTPTLWRMAHNGIQFTDYYQFDSAGTTGGECGNLFGLMPTEGGSSVKLTSTHNNYLTMGNALNRVGYDGWAFHNNTYTYYSRDVTHVNLGYNNGYMGYGNGMEQWVEWQWPESDLEMVRGTFDDVYGSTDHEPFNVYYMSVSGHSGYTPGENAMARKNWDAVADLPYSDPVKGYLAANVELDHAMEYLITRLEEEGMDKRTLIVIGADHFPYGLDDDGPLGRLPYTSELYGYDVQTYFQRDHNRLIMWSASLEDEEPIVVDTPMGAIDVLPTLLNLFGCEWDSRLLPGRDVFSDKDPLVFDLSYDWKSALGTYYAGSGEFVANEGAKVPEGYVDATSADVANRINYCRGVLTTDYYRHVFGDPEDAGAVHDKARAARDAATQVLSGVMG